jgi:hypothetical protein
MMGPTMRTILMLSLLALIPGQLGAAEDSYCHSLELKSTPWNREHTLPLFDPSLGTLTKEDFDYPAICVL